MRRFTCLPFLLGLITVACGGGGNGAETTTSTTAVATTTTSAATTVAPTTTLPPSTTTTSPPVQTTSPTTTLFPVSGDLDDWAALGLTAAQGFNTSLAAKDAEAFVSYFSEGARIIDPINPGITLRPAGYASYLFERVGEDEPLGVIHVNAGGTAEQRSAESFLAGVEPPPEEPMILLRHLTLEDGKISRLVHYFEYEAATSYPEAVVTVVGFPAAASYVITDAAPVAQGVFDAFFDAWAPADPEAIEALYANDAGRFDAMLGSVAAGDMASFVTDLLTDWPELRFEPGLSYLNGWGCAATYTIQTGECPIPTISIFEVAGDGAIANEFVYYDAGAARSCGWDRSSP